MELGLLTVCGGLICLDRRGAFQLMISQPLVVVPAMGLIMGDLALGLWLGSMLQLLWLSSLMVGTNVPPNETVAAVVVGGMALLYERHVSPGGAEVDVVLGTLAILLGAPTAQVSRLLDIRIDRANHALLARADEAARAGAPGAITRLLWRGLLRIFLSGVVVIGPALALGVGLLMVIEPALSVPLRRAIEVVGLYVIPALGFAVALSTLRRRKALLVAAASFLVAMAVINHGEGMG